MKNLKTLILASQSPYRARLLSRLALPFKVARPDFDERQAQEQLQAKNATPIDVARYLARGKALSIARQMPSATVIGSDQLLNLDSEIFGKPSTFENACAQLQRLSGRTHELITAVCLCINSEPTQIATTVAAAAPSVAVESAPRIVVDDSFPTGAAQGAENILGQRIGDETSMRLSEFEVIARITFRKLSLDEIQAYVERDQPLDCAGSYKIEKSALTLMKRVECTDWTAIEGLPLIELQRHLRQLC